MIKPIPVNIPHPSSGAYANTRIYARTLQGFGGFTSIIGLSLLTQKDNSSATFVGAAYTVIGIGCAILGCDVYKGATNVENFHKKNFSTIDKLSGIPKKVKTEEALNAATEGLFLQNFYRDFATGDAVTFNNLETRLLPKKS